MNIALVASVFYGDPTYHNVFNSLRSRLVSRGHRVVIITRAADKNVPMLFPAANDEAVHTLGIPPGSCISWLLNPVLLPLELFRIIRQENIQILHLHFMGWFRAWFVCLLLAAIFSPVKLILTFQDFDRADQPRPWFWRRLGMRRLVMNAVQITAVSHFIVRKMGHDYPGTEAKTTVVYNGVEMAKASREGVPRERKPYMLSVGRIAAYKGMDVVALALHDALKIGSDLDWVVCGPDFSGGALKELTQKLGIAEHTQFTGLCSRDDVAALLDGCLFYVLTPRAESFGMSIVEAMAAGKAIIATRVGAIPEYLKDGENAILLESAKPGALSAAMIRLQEDPRLRKRLGENAKRDAIRFDWETISHDYLNVYVSSMLLGLTKTGKSKA